MGQCVIFHVSLPFDFHGVSLGQKFFNHPVMKFIICMLSCYDNLVLRKIHLLPMLNSSALLLFSVGKGGENCSISHKLLSSKFGPSSSLLFEGSLLLGSPFVMWFFHLMWHFSREFIREGYENHSQIVNTLATRYSLVFTLYWIQ